MAQSFNALAVVGNRPTQALNSLQADK